ncbi:MAG TPA: serine/threonine-protein kinase [Gemmataceae bacterium]|jgi:serine/threonine-protein kinase
MSADSLLHSDADELLRRAATELRRHLETDPDGRAETVLDAYPSLASDPARALELIVLEFQFRRQRGQNPQPSDWYARFPQWSELLRARLEGVPHGLARANPETAEFPAPTFSEAHQETPIDVDLDVPVLGRHKILDELDRGGMGVVYRAHDLVLDREVALKVIRSGTLASIEEVRRFYREARAAAQLRHPNIVPIYGMGLYEQQHCFTMPLFPRGSLAQHLADYRRDAQEAVRLLVKVARAVQAAHEQGIVHRDLKPGNILLDEHGEPIVSDFGLAKSLIVSATLTLPTHPVGTPAYMAPEQARCEAATMASDIWSLGVILYELLTGRLPFPGNGMAEITQRVLHEDPIFPRRFCPDLPRDLQTIILTCLEKEPSRRYKSAAALADDLERWLCGEPIHARPEPQWQRLRRQFRRRVGKKGVLLLLVGLMMLGAGGTAVWTLFIYLSPEAKEKRSQELVLAFLQRELAEGKSVTLVGPVGPPMWYRWRTEIGRSPLPEQQNWPLDLGSVPGPLLLELLPDPHLRSYRFSADVQRCTTDLADPEIGLYFACEELATPEGREQCFRLFRLKVVNSETRAEHLLFGFIEQDVNRRRRRLEIVPPSISRATQIFRVPRPVAANPSEQPWRRIEVQVTPVEVKGFCDGLPMGGYVIAQEQKDLLDNWQLVHKGNCPLPTLPLHGGLGLFVINGPVYFRNVVVAPLQQP